MKQAIVARGKERRLVRRWRWRGGGGIEGDGGGAEE